MREAAFIHRNKDKWQRLESALEGLDHISADEASDLYIQLTDDLSYARTFYPDSKITEHLNGLAVRLHHHIYRNKRTPRGRIISFWTREVPLAMAKARPHLLTAFIVFFIAMCIGALSARHDETFVRLVLGDGYVDMTLDNIRRGEPMAVYGGMDQNFMFMGITINNIRVALFAFAAGILAYFGTAYVLFFNGIMVGAFQYFFHQHGVLRESLLTIWVHGTLEISAIVVAGCAGFMLGHGYLFPGTYTRGESFRRNARISLKVVMGLVPIFITAGFLESFVTRHALTMHPLVAVMIIGISLLFVIHYFIILPFHAERRANAPPGVS